jgi:hypothetical protein
MRLLWLRRPRVRVVKLLVLETPGAKDIRRPSVLMESFTSLLTVELLDLTHPVDTKT